MKTDSIQNTMHHASVTTGLNCYVSNNRYYSSDIVDYTFLSEAECSIYLLCIFTGIFYTVLLVFDSVTQETERKSTNLKMPKPPTRVEP